MSIYTGQVPVFLYHCYLYLWSVSEFAFKPTLASGAFRGASPEYLKSMVKAAHDEAKALLNRPGTSRQVHNQGLSPDNGHPPAEHGPVRHLHGLHADEFSDSGCA